jgi:hypothetical protein
MTSEREVITATCFVCGDEKPGHTPIAKLDLIPPFVCFECEAEQRDDEDGEAGEDG